MTGTENQPIILAFINDLLFSPRLESAAQKQGSQVFLIERGDFFKSNEPAPAIRQFAEHTLGPGATLIDKVSLWMPVLIIFDLNNQEIPWREWIALLKSAPATRRIPIISFGSHKDTTAIKSARDAGADAFFARSRFVQDLPEILAEYMRKSDLTGLQEACQLPLSDLALMGIDLFNRQQFFEAHEKLEEAWNDDQTPGRELYRAILQVAVAYLQIQRQNYTGAVKMFLRLRQWIEPLPDSCRGVDVERLRLDAQAVYNLLTESGREKISEFDQNLFKPLVYQM